MWADPKQLDIFHVTLLFIKVNGNISWVRQRDAIYYSGLQAK